MASDDGGVGRPVSAPVRSDPGAVSGGHSSPPVAREARLRPEFAEKYVGIQSGIWFEELPQRVLDPMHFEFRGGEGGASRSNSPR